MKKKSNPNPPEENAVKSNLNWLGVRVKDRVTGYDGVVTSVSFDLYGCVQVLITRPSKNEDAENPFQSWWIDIKRVDSIHSQDHKNYRVMSVPDFFETAVGDEIGAADKPIP